MNLTKGKLKVVIMNLKRHDIWGIYGDRASSFEDYVKNFVPDMKLRSEVSEDVVKVYSVIKSLVKHGYYEYEFIDVAVAKLLQTFEMALKIRYKELNQKKWPAKKPLVQLIEWFRTRGYFEVNSKEFTDHIRNIRNIFSHPESHGFGGIALFHWLDTITDLINDAYVDIESRKKRWDEVQNINMNLRALINRGVKLNIRFEPEQLIYDAKVLFVEKVDEEPNYLFYYKRLFELDEKANLLPCQKLPYQLMQLKNFEFKFTEDKCTIGMFKISLLTNKKDQTEYDKWIKRFYSHSHYQAYDSMIGFEIEKWLKDKRRKSLHEQHFKN